jgi:hypothetical protein
MSVFPPVSDFYVGKSALGMSIHAALMSFDALRQLNDALQHGHVFAGVDSILRPFIQSLHKLRAIPEMTLGYGLPGAKRHHWCCLAGPHVGNAQRRSRRLC